MEELLTFLTQYGKYVMGCFIVSPLLFVLINQVWVAIHAKKIALKWEKQESGFLSYMEKNELKALDKRVRGELQKQLQGSLLFVTLFVVNLLLQPIVLILTLGTAPFLLWIITVIFLMMRVKKRMTHFEENGLSAKGLIGHERLLKESEGILEFHPYVSHPFTFFYHYQRLIGIPERLSELIRSNKDSHIARQESEILAEEERWLMGELILSISGRMRHYTEELESESVDAMNAMMRHAQNPTLSLAVRHRAMVLAKQLQRRSKKESVEEARQLDAMLDIETVERFYV